MNIPPPTRPLAPGDRMLSALQVSRIYSVRPSTVLDDIRAGRLPAQNRSRGTLPRWRIHPDAALAAYGGAS